MTERRTETKAISQQLKEALGVKKLYLASEYDVSYAAQIHFEQLATQADLDAQRTFDRLSVFKNRINHDLQADDRSAEFSVALDESVKSPLDAFTQQWLSAWKRSENAYIAAYARWHKDETDPKTSAKQALETLREKNRHLYEVLTFPPDQVANTDSPSTTSAAEEPTNLNEGVSWLSRNRTPVRAGLAAAVALAAVGGYSILRSQEAYANPPDPKPGASAAPRPEKSPHPDKSQGHGQEKQNPGAEHAGGPFRTTPETGNSQGDIHGNVPGSPGKSGEHASAQGCENGEPDCQGKTPKPSATGTPSATPSETPAAITPPEFSACQVLIGKKGDLAHFDGPKDTHGIVGGSEFPEVLGEGNNGQITGGIDDVFSVKRNGVDQGDAAQCFCPPEDPNRSANQNGDIGIQSNWLHLPSNLPQRTMDRLLAFLKEKFGFQFFQARGQDWGLQSGPYAIQDLKFPCKQPKPAETATPTSTPTAPAIPSAPSAPTILISIPPAQTPSPVPAEVSPAPAPSQLPKAGEPDLKIFGSLGAFSTLAGFILRRQTKN